MPDYSKASIYWIRALADDQPAAYVGSTTDFRRRGWQHKSQCNKVKSMNHNLPLYVFIREHGGWDAWECIELERYPCSTKDELVAREQVWIDRIKPTLNGQRAKSDKKEYYKRYYQAHKAEYRERNRAWREANIDRAREYCRNWYRTHRSLAVRQSSPKSANEIV